MCIWAVDGGNREILVEELAVDTMLHVTGGGAKDGVILCWRGLAEVRM